MNRKQRRMRKKALKKAKVNESAFEQKMGLFDLIPNDCMICHAEFDKTSKEMVSTWQVTVREKEKLVVLSSTNPIFCPAPPFFPRRSGYPESTLVVKLCMYCTSKSGRACTESLEQ